MVNITNFVLDEVHYSVHVQNAVISEAVERLKLQDQSYSDGEVEEEKDDDDEGLVDRSSKDNTMVVITTMTGWCLSMTSMAIMKQTEMLSMLRECDLNWQIIYHNT